MSQILTDVTAARRERTAAMASQIHRLAEANAELASKSSDSPAGLAAHALPNGHGPVHGTTQLPGEAELPMLTSEHLTHG